MSRVIVAALRTQLENSKRRREEDERILRRTESANTERRQRIHQLSTDIIELEAAIKREEQA